jgi:hypothetical protein
MHWFWMNIPLAAMIFAIWTGVPLWLAEASGQRSRVSRSGHPPPGSGCGAGYAGGR